MTCAVLIVDPFQNLATVLCRRLISQGAQPHVFQSVTSASLLLKSKRIDTMVLPFDADLDILELSESAKTLGVPVVFMSNVQGSKLIDAWWSVGGTHASSIRCSPAGDHVSGTP